MKRWLSIKDVCEQCGIERTTFYRRQNSPNWPTLVPLEKMKPRIYFKAEDVDTYHAMINGKKLDYWPSRMKFQYEGRVQRGDVYRFIAKITRPTKDTTHE